MFIDSFADDWLAELDSRAQQVAAPHGLYLLIDGAFEPRLHRMLGDEAKACLFARLPGANEESLDVSPFLTPYATSSHTLLKRCNRWPMVSVIETPEPMEKLAERLVAWCVIEVDRQRFNFRFADTRRLPAIYQTLRKEQRAQFSGPAVRWSYVARDGRWRHLAVEGVDHGIAERAVLDDRQFAILVEDCEADVLIALLGDDGLDVYRHPSRSHALVSMAQRLAKSARLGERELASWCKWFWKNDQLPERADSAFLVNAWRNQTMEA